MPKKASQQFGEGGVSAPEQAPVQVPNLLSSPIWSLRPWPVVVSLAGRDFEIPAMSATSWLSCLMEEELDLEDVFPGLTGREDEIMDLVVDGEQTLDDLELIALDVISAASGRPWWVAMRLIGAAAGSWQILGPAMIRRVDPNTVSLSGWLDVLLVEILDRMKPEQAQMFALRLEMPPPELTDAVVAEPEMDASAFMAMG